MARAELFTLSGTVYRFFQYVELFTAFHGTVYRFIT